MAKQFEADYKTDDVMIIIPNPTLRLIIVNNCVDVERDELKSVLDLGQIDWLRNPTLLVEHVLKAVATAPNALVSLDEIRSAIEADINDPEELDRLTVEAMEELYPANEYDWEPDLLEQAIRMLVGLLDHMDRLQPIVDMALNPGDVGSYDPVGARLTRIGQALKELAFGTDPKVRIK